jgi:autotransporter-associated beta strand protein
VSALARWVMIVVSFRQTVARGAVAMLAVVAILGRPGPASGQVTWDNVSGDNLWNTAANWSDNQVPTTSTTIQLNQALTGASSILLPAGGTFTAGTAEIYQNVTGAISAGTTTITWQKTGDGANPQLTIAAGLGVGNGSYSNVANPYTTLTGALVTDGVDLTVGSDGQRATMELGRRGFSGEVNGNTIGRLQVTSGGFTGYLSSLTLGGKSGSGAEGQYGRGTGRLDLSAATITAPLLDISGDARIAAPVDARHDYIDGDLLVRSGSVSIGGSLYVSLYEIPFQFFDSGRRGTVTVTDTPIVVSATGSAVLGGRLVSTTETWKNGTAFVTSNVAGQVSGLDLTNSAAAALTITAATTGTGRSGAYNKIAVNFQADPGTGGYDSDGWYWGFRRAGNHQTTMQNLITPEILQIDDTGLSAGLQKATAADYVTYDAGSGKTYVGISLFGSTQTVNMANVAGSLLRLNNTSREIGSLEGLAGSAVELGSGTLSLGANNQASASFAGVISGAGGLVKQGSGVQLLGGSNTYAGLTDVTAGGLLVNGSVAGNVAVAAGAWLGGIGSLGGSLSLADGAGLVFDPANSGLQLPAGNNVTIASTFDIDSLVNADGTTIDWGSVADGTYTLLGGTTTSFAGIGNFGPGNAKDLGGGRSAYFADGSLQLVVVPEPSLAAVSGIAIVAAAWALRRRR